MSTQIEQIELGAAPNDKTGTPLRNGGAIINENTTKLFNLSNKIDEGKMHVFKYPANTSITAIEQKDYIEGIIESEGVKYFIKAQYNTGPDDDFGTASGFFNNGSYYTLNFTELN